MELVMGKHMQTLEPINNLVGRFASGDLAPPVGSQSAVFALVLPAAELTDTSNYLRLELFAEFGQGPKLMARGDEWHGGPGQVNPSVTWQFGGVVPLAVFGVVVNGTRGKGSEAKITSGSTSFA